MTYKTNISKTDETLPFETFIPQGATKLILGTFPPVKDKWSFEFFYPNRNNDFWNIIDDLTNKEFQLSESESNKELEVAKRKDALSKLNMGITDIGHKIYRRLNSSADTAIFPIEYTNIFKILEEHPSISKIIMTSKDVKKNSVEGWMADYFAINDETFPTFDQKENPRRAHFNFQGREVELVTVHSPSRQTIKILKEDKLEMYRNEIVNN